ncbi:MAG: preprotein translocase subunit SecG [Acidobacteriota bacterium]
MIYILYTIFFASCVLLVATVLLQPGKTDAGALFTSNISNSAFGPRGTATVLSKLTIGAATAFFLSALLISMPALTGNVSVLSANPDAPAETNSNTAPANTSPASDANANAVAPANTAGPANTDANAAPANK